MKFGVNTQVWTLPFTGSSFGLVEKIRNLGFDVIEITLGSDEPPFDIPELKRRLKDSAMEATICGTLDVSRDITSEDIRVQQHGLDYLKMCIDTCCEIDARILCGPLYAELFRTRLVSAAVKALEWKRCVSNLKKACKYAEEAGVVIAIEPLNRFETDFLNRTEQGLRLITEVDSSHLKLLLDTFHMNIEEDSLGSAIRTAGKEVQHFHACANNRGVPGGGHIEWNEVKDALHDIDYKGFLVIESFNWEIEALANGACIWYPLARSQDIIAKEGLAFLKQMFG